MKVQGAVLDEHGLPEGRNDGHFPWSFSKNDRHLKMTVILENDPETVKFFLFCHAFEAVHTMNV